MPFFLLTLVLWSSSLLADPAPAGAGAESVANGSAPTEMPRVVMARVGSHELTVEEFMQFLARNPGEVHKATTPEGKAELLRAAIANQLLLQAMQAQDLVSDEPSDIDIQRGFLALERKHFPPPPRPSEEDMRVYYESHKSDFGIPAAVRLKQIQLRVAKESTPEEKAAVKQRAEAALRRIEAGEPFSDVAAELTENPIAKKNKGDVGFVWRDGSDWLETALKGLSVGEHTGVLESPVGYDILELTDERPAEITPFAKARDDVAKRMQLEQQRTARNAYVKDLAAQYGVEILLEEMKGAYPKGVFP